MLWLAGLMGVMAVGAVAFVDPYAMADDGDDQPFGRIGGETDVVIGFPDELVAVGMD